MAVEHTQSSLSAWQAKLEFQLYANSVHEKSLLSRILERTLATWSGALFYVAGNAWIAAFLDSKDTTSRELSSHTRLTGKALLHVVLWSFGLSFVAYAILYKLHKVAIQYRKFASSALSMAKKGKAKDLDELTSDSVRNSGVTAPAAIARAEDVEAHAAPEERDNSNNDKANDLSDIDIKVEYQRRLEMAVNRNEDAAEAAVNLHVSLVDKSIELLSDSWAYCLTLGWVLALKSICNIQNLQEIWWFAIIAFVLAVLGLAVLNIVPTRIAKASKKGLTVDRWERFILVNEFVRGNMAWFTSLACVEAVTASAYRGAGLAFNYYGVNPPAIGPQWAAAAIVLVPVIVATYILDKAIVTRYFATRMGVPKGTPIDDPDACIAAHAPKVRLPSVWWELWRQGVLLAPETAAYLATLTIAYASTAWAKKDDISSVDYRLLAVLCAGLAIVVAVASETVLKILEGRLEHSTRERQRTASDVGGVTAMFLAAELRELRRRAHLDIARACFKIANRTLSYLAGSLSFTATSVMLKQRVGWWYFFAVGMTLWAVFFTFVLTRGAQYIEGRAKARLTQLKKPLVEHEHGADARHGHDGGNGDGEVATRV